MLAEVSPAVGVENNTADRVAGTAENVDTKSALDEAENIAPAAGGVEKRLVLEPVGVSKRPGLLVCPLTPNVMLPATHHHTYLKDQPYILVFITIYSYKHIHRV